MVKTVKALQDSDILMKGSTETLQNDAEKGGALPILPMLLGTLGVSLLSGRGLYRASEEKGLFRSGYGMYRTDGEEIKKSINFTKTTSLNKF